MENKNEFRINDFYQAVVLKTAGVPLIRLERTHGRFFDFIFDDSAKAIEVILQEYWNKSLKLPAREIIENINELKTRIHSGV